MDKWLLEQMKVVNQEEQAYLNGDIQVQKDLYTRKDIFEIDSKMFLEQGKLVTVRHHSRFVDFPLHRHNYIEMVYVCTGEITHYIDGKTLVTKPGDMLLMNQYIEHSVKMAGTDDLGINFIALPEFFDIPLQMMKKHNAIADFLIEALRHSRHTPQYLVFHLQEHKSVTNLLENMIASLFFKNKNEDEINQYSMGLVFLYLINHLDTLAQNSSNSYEDIIIQATLKYIDSEYKTATLSHIADDFKLSLPALSRMIKKNTGFTFLELLMRKRFQKAIMLLIETKLPVEDIVADIGYENQSHFYRQFKKRYGMTPSQYRIVHKNDTTIRI